MNGKTILSVASPLTQSVGSVKQLIAYQNHGQEPAEMPPVYRLGSEMVLVRSNKGDVYYVTTSRTCSCPSAAYRPGQACKHRRAHFPAKEEAAKAANLAEVLEEHDRNLPSMPRDYRRMVREAREKAEADPLELVPKGPFRPTLEEAIATERSMLGDAPGRVDLSEPEEAV
jgi:hypothetical protein